MPFPPPATAKVADTTLRCAAEFRGVGTVERVEKGRDVDQRQDDQEEEETWSVASQAAVPRRTQHGAELHDNVLYCGCWVCEG